MMDKNKKLKIYNAADDCANELYDTIVWAK